MISSGRIAMGDVIDICVPTGNFGNILAAYFAKRMGLPFGRLICASNVNHVLTDFLRSGTYDRNRPFHSTISPSMDILISSNLERLLYLAFGAERCSELMRELSEKGCYTLSSEELSVINADFVGYYCDESKTKAAIRAAWREHGYLCDTHTAVGYGAALDFLREESGDRCILLASTASPYKFACDVYEALFEKMPTDDLSALDELARETSTEIPAPLSGIGSRAVRFSDVISPEEMARITLDFAD
jgi:threonine synthase